VSFSFPIIDPHIHLWDLQQTPRSLTLPRRLLGWNDFLYNFALRHAGSPAIQHFVGRTDYVGHNYLPSDYLQDRAQLPIRTVAHIEVDWCDRKGNGPAGETRWLDELFCNSPLQLGAIIGYAELQRPDIDSQLQAHLQASKRFAGIRQVLACDSDEGVLSGCEHPDLTRQPAFRRGMAVLEQHNLTFDAWIYNNQSGELLELVKAFPGVTFVLDHMATPIGIGGPFASYGRSEEARRVLLRTWQLSLEQFAEQPNVMVKLSGMFMPVLGWGFEHRKEAPGLQELLDKTAHLFEFALHTFGVGRCMFASNFPMDKVSLSLQQLYEFYDVITASLSETERRKLFHDNAARTYRMAAGPMALSDLA